MFQADGAMNITRAKEGHKKKKGAYDLKNRELCGEIRILFDYLVKLVEKRKSSCFSDLKKFLVKKREKCKDDPRASKCGILCSGEVLRFIKNELQKINVNHSDSSVILDDVETFEIIIDLIRERVEEIVILNIALVKSVAPKYLNGEDEDLFYDLVQEGARGMMRAIYNYERQR